MRHAAVKAVKADVDDELKRKESKRKAKIPPESEAPKTEAKAPKVRCSKKTKSGDIATETQDAKPAGKKRTMPSRLPATDSQ